jgi:hypothetical protein
MQSSSALRELIDHFYHQAEAHAALENEAGALICFALHSINLERLISLEYVRMRESGMIAPFVARPTLREKCDAVLYALDLNGFGSDAISSDRFSVLMPMAGVVKHALYPRIQRMSERIAWVRDASLDLYRHYFGEPMPPARGSATGYAA